MIKDFNILHAICLNFLIGFTFAFIYMKVFKRYRRKDYEDLFFSQEHEKIFFLIVVLFYPFFMFLEFMFLYELAKNSIQSKIKNIMFRITLYKIRHKVIKVLKEKLKRDPSNETLRESIKNLKR